MGRPRFTHERLGAVLLDLLREREWSQRHLADVVGVDPAYISRVVRGADERGASPAFASRVAVALGLPRDYFPEYREAQVIAAVRRDPQLRERLYRTLDGRPAGARKRGAATA